MILSWREWCELHGRPTMTKEQELAREWVDAEWRQWACFVFTKNDAIAQAMTTNELRKAICEAYDADVKAATGGPKVEESRQADDAVARGSGVSTD